MPTHGTHQGKSGKSVYPYAIRGEAVLNLVLFKVWHCTNVRYTAYMKLKFLTFCSQKSHSHFVRSRQHRGCIINSTGILILIIKPTRSINFSIFLGLELYMFRTVPLFIVRSLVLYTQQYVYVIQVMLTAC